MYDVEVQDLARSRVDCRLRVSAASPGEAVLRVRGTLPRGDGHVYAVYRHRRVRGRRLVGMFDGGSPGGDGLAGVREPRRPLPSPPSLSLSLDEPRDADRR